MSLVDRHSNNIGTLRFIGAFLVLFGHSYHLVGNDGVSDPFSLWILNFSPQGPYIHGLGVILFFAISGYLVTQSYLNYGNLFKYLLARISRIYPALIVAVLFCAYGVGLIYTTLPKLEYLNHPRVNDYVFVNSTLKSIRFSLPGVFEDLPVAGGINGSLWTLPVEVRLYVMVAILGVLGILKRTWLFNITAVLGVAAFLYWPERMPVGMSPNKPVLFLSFVLGMFFCLNKKYILPDLKVLLLITGLCVGMRFWDTAAYYDDVIAIAFGCAVLYMGFYCPVRLPRMDRFGDFSYGLYLYAFPVQQMIVAWLGPGQPLRMVCLSFIGTLLLAILSWYLIEQPIMKWVKKLNNSSKRDRELNAWQSRALDEN